MPLSTANDLSIRNSLTVTVQDIIGGPGPHTHTETHSLGLYTM